MSNFEKIAFFNAVKKLMKRPKWQQSAVDQIPARRGDCHCQPTKKDKSIFPAVYLTSENTKEQIDPLFSHCPVYYVCSLNHSQLLPTLEIIEIPWIPNLHGPLLRDAPRDQMEQSLQSLGAVYLSLGTSQQEFKKFFREKIVRFVLSQCPSSVLIHFSYFKILPNIDGLEFYARFRENSEPLTHLWSWQGNRSLVGIGNGKTFLFELECFVQDKNGRRPDVI